MSTNYQITQNADASWTVVDLRSGSPDGTDTLRNIEYLQFNDKTVAVGPMTPSVLTTVIELAGSISLVAVGTKFFLDSISTGSDPSLKYSGAEAVASVWWLDADWRRADGERLSGSLENPGRRSVFGLDHR